MTDMGSQSPHSLRRLLQQRVQEATEEQERAWGEVVDASTPSPGGSGKWSTTPQEILGALGDTERMGVLFALVGFMAVLMGLAYGTVHVDRLLLLVRGWGETLQVVVPPPQICWPCPCSPCDARGAAPDRRA